MERVCFLHIGTHKTGTTSLQLFLTSNELRFEQCGLLIPRGGRPKPGSGGHHNLAWELSGDHRYDPQFGSWREVLDEMAHPEIATACLSSEDFGLLYQKPGSLQRIKQELRAVGYRVRIIIYLRPQADCVESAYAELARNRVPVGFREYLEGNLLRERQVPPPVPPPYPFDYREMLEPFAEVFGQEALVVRAYKKHRRTRYLVNDFLSIILSGRKISGLNYYFSRARHNPSLNFAQVVERTLAERFADGAAGSGARISHLTQGRFMQGRFDPLDLSDLISIRRRMRAANRALREQYQVKLPTMSAGRLLRELICSTGLNRASLKRKALLAALDQARQSPRIGVREPI